MSTTTTRTGDIGQNFQQTTVGETPNSISVSTNAKGQAQVDVKLYFATPDDMASNVACNLIVILKEVRAALSALGIPMAGEGK